jgi:2-methylcitrate dehydratase PrpD
MFDGDVSNDSYMPERLHDPRILGFMRKIAVTETSAFAADAHHRGPERWARLFVCSSDHSASRMPLSVPPANACASLLGTLSVREAR